MQRCAAILLAVFFFCNEIPARLVPQSCGTYRGIAREKLQLHRKAQRKIRLTGTALAAARTDAQAASTNQDYGDIAVIDDGDGVLAELNAFDLNQKTVTFAPVAADAAAYRFRTGAGSYDAQAAAAGTPLTGLGDDDTRLVKLPFAFPFFGVLYDALYVNSDGNITFGSGDSTSADRSLGRMLAGAPRIAPLFDDLDPTKSGRVTVLADPQKFVVSWDQVPEYSDYGNGAPQTLQARLYPDGRIELVFGAVTAVEGVAGISPGGLIGPASVVSFVDGGGEQDFTSSIVERFTQNPEIDIVTAAQKFYQTHEDSYDYLVLFNGFGLPAKPGAVAYEVTVRNSRSGIGDDPADDGAEYGSQRRLQSMLNMGPLSQYPPDPYAMVPARGSSGDTTLSVLAHETGHLFLAYASVRDPQSQTAKPMLGRQLAHWAFTFNSEASFLEGNRIDDQGTGAKPRFLTTGTVQQYAPLDQYLMGFRAPEEVAATFLVQNATISPLVGPRSGVAFDGSRRDVTVEEVAQAEGRRIPDHTVAQRNFRFAFILVVHKGTEPPPEQLAQIETYRSEFETYYSKAASNRATADTALKSSLSVSFFPAVGVLQDGSVWASISASKRLDAAVTLLLRSKTGAVTVPPSVTILTGAASVGFYLRGNAPGVDEVTIEPSDSRFETVVAKVQVTNPTNARIVVVSGSQQTPLPGAAFPLPVVFKVTDANDLPYPNVAVKVSLAGGGSVTPAAAVSDSKGLVQFDWTAGPTLTNSVTATLDGVANGPSAMAVSRSSPQFGAGAVVNAASFASGISPGALATVYGVNLAAGTEAQGSPPFPTQLGGVTVLLDGNPLPLVYVVDSQINFYVPPETAVGQGTLTVQHVGGTSAPVNVPIIELQPGIFFDSVSGAGAILVSGSGQTTLEHPATGGDVLEIYCTGLGPVAPDSTGLSQTTNTVTVRIGNTPAEVLYSGLAPGFIGLYQVNAQVSASAPVGLANLQLTIQGQASNEVKIKLN